MKYEDALKIWAACKLNDTTIKPEDILDVRFEFQEGYAYSSWTYEPGFSRVVVDIKDSSPRTIWDVGFDTDNISFGQIIQELAKIAENGSFRSDLPA